MKKLWIFLVIASLTLLVGCGQPEENNAVGALPQKAGGRSRSIYQGEQLDTLNSAPETAIEAALSHAQIARENAYKIEYEFDEDDPIPHYEISFKVGNTEYEYDVHAETGKVLKWEKEDKHATFSKEDAKTVALAHAGVQEQNIRHLDIELDTEDGIPVYEIKFHSGVYEYEYDIHAKTGAVLKFNRER